MNKISIKISLLLALTFSIACSDSKKNFVVNDFELACKQYHMLISETPSSKFWPHTLNFDGTILTTSINWWTVGFFPGTLWYIYEYTKDKICYDAAINWTEALYVNRLDSSNHDIGFEMICSYGNAYRITHNKEYIPVLIESANSLCKRYSPKVGSIQSWDARLARNGVDHWNFPVIIDNLMNLELLFFATQETKDSTYYNIALQHAKKSLKNHVRPDFSTYHVVDYDPETGEVMHQQTQQGYADNSTWSRGQAWAIYGFTMCYRYTKDPDFLSEAIALANFAINNPSMPEDGIPIWDYNVGQQGYTPPVEYSKNKINLKPRDVSAAAIMASSMLELCQYCKGETSKKLFDAAEKILMSLSSDTYLAKPHTNGGFILKHSTGNMPSGFEIDVPLIYADYYFVEALSRYDSLMNKHN